jgi:hyperosmotically inducible protein
MRTTRHLTSAVLVLALLAPLLSSCGGGSRPVRTEPDDLTITARVKTALLNAPDIAAPRIDVETVNRVVTLSGRVQSKEEEQKAIAIARSVSGVADVKSTLQVSDKW